MFIKSILCNVHVITLMLTLVASSPIDTLLDSQHIGSTVLTNKDIFNLVETSNRENKVLELWCSFMPSVWDNPATSLRPNDNGCVLVKAKSSLTVACYHTSLMTVNNHRDRDFCLSYSEQPRLEHLTEICDSAPDPLRHSFGWIKGGLWYGIMCATNAKSSAPLLV